MKKNYLLIVALFLSALSFNALSDNALYVSSNGNDNNDGTTSSTALKTLAKAATKLTDNTPTTIYVEENVVFDVSGPSAMIVGDNKKVTVLGKNTTLTSGDKPYLGNRILRIGKNTDLKISGFVFQNACTRDGVAGGAVFFEGNRLEIDSCTFINNEANNSGGAIASIGKELIITNTVFDANRVFGGYASGAVIYQAGLPNAANNPGSLIIRNCAFTNNVSQADTRGDIISFNFAYRDYPSSSNKYTHLYSNVNYFEMVNCVFKDNVPGNSPSVRPASSDIYINEVRDDFEMNLVNNTFYKTKVVAIPFFYDSPYRIVNNVFHNTEGKYSIMSSNTSDERDPLIAYNNVFVGSALGNNMDDPALTSQKEAYGNQFVSEVALLGLTPIWKKDGSYVPYIPITSESSILIDKGLSSTASLGGFNGKELIPAADVRGVAVSGTSKDVGAFEFASSSGIFSPSVTAQAMFTISRSGDNAVIKNLTNKTLNLEVRLLDGRSIYSAQLNDEIIVNKSELKIANGVLIFVASDRIETQSIKTILF